MPKNNLFMLLLLVMQLSQIVAQEIEQQEEGKNNKSVLVNPIKVFLKDVAQNYVELVIDSAQLVALPKFIAPSYVHYSTASKLIAAAYNVHLKKNYCEKDNIIFEDLFPSTEDNFNKPIFVRFKMQLRKYGTFLDEDAEIPQFFIDSL